MGASHHIGIFYVYVVQYARDLAFK